MTPPEAEDLVEQLARELPRVGADVYRSPAIYGLLRRLHDQLLEVESWPLARRLVGAVWREASAIARREREERQRLRWEIEQLSRRRFRVVVGVDLAADRASQYRGPQFDLVVVDDPAVEVDTAKVAELINKWVLRGPLRAVLPSTATVDLVEGTIQQVGDATPPREVDPQVQRREAENRARWRQRLLDRIDVARGRRHYDAAAISRWLDATGGQVLPLPKEGP